MAVTPHETNPMDALKLAAEYVGAVVVVTSSADQRDTNGRRFLADIAPSRLRRLAVVRPNRDAPHRWAQLHSGRVLCIASLETLEVDEAASLLLTHESLQNRRQAA